MARNTVIRSMHDIGLAAWFGGSLMGAIGLNAASGSVSDPSERAQVASEGWARWTPVNAAAIGAHLIGGAGLLVANRDRAAHQQGVMAMIVTKSALTGVALGLTAYSGLLGRQVAKRAAVPVSSGAVPSDSTPTDVAEPQRKLRQLQWLIPLTTGAMLVTNALAGEQQRPAEVQRGIRERILSRG